MFLIALLLWWPMPPPEFRPVRWRPCPARVMRGPHGRLNAEPRNRRVKASIWERPGRRA